MKYVLLAISVMVGFSFNNVSQATDEDLNQEVKKACQSPHDGVRNLCALYHVIDHMDSGDITTAKGLMECGREMFGAVDSHSLAIIVIKTLLVEGDALRENLLKAIGDIPDTLSTNYPVVRIRDRFFVDCRFIDKARSLGIGLLARKILHKL